MHSNPTVIDRLREWLPTASDRELNKANRAVAAETNSRADERIAAAEKLAKRGKKNGGNKTRGDAAASTATS